MKKPEPMKKPYINLEKPVVLNKGNIMAIGSAIISKDYQTAKFSLEYLRKTVEIFERMDVNAVTFAIAKDVPLAIGEYDKKTKKICGVIIAPRVDEE